jgi:hypothetical protein
MCVSVRAQFQPGKAKLWPGDGVCGHVCTDVEARRERRSRRRLDNKSHDEDEGALRLGLGRERRDL